MDWKGLVHELRRYFPSGRVEIEGGGAAPEYITVSFPNIDDPDTDRVYTLGDSNRTWNGGFYAARSRTIDDGLDPDGFVESHLSVLHTDPWLVALNLAAAISRYEADN